VLVLVEVPVAEPAAAIRVQRATVRELRVAVLAPVWRAAPAVGQVLVLLRVVARQAGGREVVQAFLVDREAVSGEPGLRLAADLALVQVLALTAGPVVAQGSPVVREVIRVPALRALREARQEDRARKVVQRGMAVALQVMQAVAQVRVEAGAAPVAGQRAARVVALVAGRVVVVQGVLRAMAVPAPAITANAV